MTPPSHVDGLYEKIFKVSSSFCKNVQVYNFATFSVNLAQWNEDTVHIQSILRSLVSIRLPIFKEKYFYVGAELVMQAVPTKSRSLRTVDDSNFAPWQKFCSKLTRDPWYSPCRSARAAITGFVAGCRLFSRVRFINIFILICCCSVSTMFALSASSCFSLVMVVSVSSCRAVRLCCSSVTWCVSTDTCRAHSVSPVPNKVSDYIWLESIFAGPPVQCWAVSTAG